MKMIKVENVLTEKDKKHKEWIYSLIQLTDKRLASAAADGKINIYNSVTLEVDIKIKDKYNFWHCLSEIEPMKIIASSILKYLVIYAIKDNTYIMEKEIFYPERTLTVRVILPLSNHRMVFSYNNASLSVYNSQEPYNLIFPLLEALKVFPQEEYPSMRPIKTSLGLVEVSGERLITIGQDGVLIFWDLKTYKRIMEMKGIECYSQNSLMMIDKNTLIVGGCNQINIINVRDYQLITKCKNIYLETIYCFCKINNHNILVGTKYNLFLLKSSIDLIDLKKLDEDKATITSMMKLNDNTIVCTRGLGQVHFMKYSFKKMKKTN